MVEVEYAKALFELAEEQTKTDCMDQLSLIAQILDEEPEFTKLLKSPFLSVKEKTEMIKTVFPFLNPLLKEWMILLIKRDRMDLFCRIKDSYQQLYETSFKILKIKVVSPKILDERQQEQLKQRLKQKYPDRKLEIENTIDIVRANEVLNIVTYQLLKPNRKFQYGLMRTGGRSKDYEKALEYLSLTGIVYKCHKVTEVTPPLSKCKDVESFKLYLNDTGILYMMMHLSKIKLLSDDNLKYILYENSVANAIMSSGYNLYYYQSEGKAEVPFVIQTRSGKIIPVEIVNKNVSKAKSLSLFMSRFNINEAIRITEDNFGLKKNVKYIPIYASFCLKDNN